MIERKTWIWLAVATLGAAIALAIAALDRPLIAIAIGVLVISGDYLLERIGWHRLALLTLATAIVFAALLAFFRFP